MVVRIGREWLFQALLGRQRDFEGERRSIVMLTLVVIIAVVDEFLMGHFTTFHHVRLMMFEFIGVMMMVVHLELVEVLVRHGLHEHASTLASYMCVINCQIIIFVVHVYNVFAAANAPASVLLDEQPGKHGGHDSDGRSDFPQRYGPSSVQQSRLDVIT